MKENTSHTLDAICLPHKKATTLYVKPVGCPSGIDGDVILFQHLDAILDWHTWPRSHVVVLWLAQGSQVLFDGVKFVARWANWSVLKCLVLGHSIILCIDRRAIETCMSFQIKLISKLVMFLSVKIFKNIFLHAGSG